MPRTLTKRGIKTKSNISKYHNSSKKPKKIIIKKIDIINNNDISKPYKILDYLKEKNEQKNQPIKWINLKNKADNKSLKKDLVIIKDNIKTETMLKKEIQTNIFKTTQVKIIQDKFNEYKIEKISKKDKINSLIYDTYIKAKIQS